MAIHQHWLLDLDGWVWHVCHLYCKSIEHGRPLQMLMKQSATASKANWITLFTGVSYERLQVFHRWISYAFFILALLHTFPFIVYHIRWHDMEKHFASSLVFYWTGIVALLFQAWLTFASHSTIRLAEVKRLYIRLGRLTLIAEILGTSSSK